MDVLAGLVTHVHHSTLFSIAGTLYFCSMAPLSFAIFFVTLDRIIALQKPTLLTSANRKRMLLAQIIVQVASYIGMVLYEVIPEMPDGDKITCEFPFLSSAYSITYFSVYGIWMHERYGRRQDHEHEALLRSAELGGSYHLYISFRSLQSATNAGQPAGA